MKRMKWKWILPIVQFVLALACDLYEPHEYRLGLSGGGSIEYVFQHSPASVGRISRAINFPALVLDYPLRNKDNPLYRHNSDYTLIWIAPSRLLKNA
jgi:hypothetical protein